MDKMSNIMTSY